MFIVDIRRGPSIGLWNQGLRFQTVHHLFPRWPRLKLRRLQRLIKQVSADTKITHNIQGFTDDDRKVPSQPEKITAQSNAIIKCQNCVAQTR